MYLVRNVFQVKPGQARSFIELMKSMPMPEGEDKKIIKNSRMLVDVAAPFWTIIWEDETDDLNKYLGATKGMGKDPKMKDFVKQYTEKLMGGYREIFSIEETK